MPSVQQKHFWCGFLTSPEMQPPNREAHKTDARERTIECFMVRFLSSPALSKADDNVRGANPRTAELPERREGGSEGKQDLSPAEFHFDNLPTQGLHSQARQALPRRRNWDFQQEGTVMKKLAALVLLAGTMIGMGCARPNEVGWHPAYNSHARAHLMLRHRRTASQ